VLAEAEQFYLKQPEVEHVIGVLGFSFFGAGRMPRSISCASRTGVNGPARTVRACAGEARQYGLVPHQASDDLCINVPPIPELAAVGGSISACRIVQGRAGTS